MQHVIIISNRWAAITPINNVSSIDLPEGIVRVHNLQECEFDFFKTEVVVSSANNELRDVVLVRVPKIP